MTFIFMKYSVIELKLYLVEAKSEPDPVEAACK